MAEVKVSSGKIKIAQSGFVAATYVFGDAGVGNAGGFIFHIFANGATFSLTTAARVAGQQAETDALAMVAVPYKKMFLNAAAGDNTYVTTPITGTSLILVPSFGQSVGLVIASLSVADLIIYAKPIADCPSY